MSSPQRTTAIAQAMIADAIPRASTTRYNRATLEALVTPPPTAAQCEFEAYCRTRGLDAIETEETILGEGAVPFPPVAHRVWQGKRSSLTRAEQTEYYEFLLGVVSAESDRDPMGADDVALPAGWV